MWLRILLNSLLLGYLLGLCVPPAFALWTLEAEPSPEITVLTKYQSWNRVYKEGL